MKNQAKFVLIAVGIASMLLVGCGGSETGSTSSTAPDSDAPPPSPPVESAAVETAATPPDEAPEPGDPEAGAKVYARICVACHQPDGKGLNGMLAASFVDDKSRLAKSDAELLHSIKNGVVANGKVMPPQKDVLSDTEMRDVLAYIRKTFGG